MKKVISACIDQLLEFDSEQEVGQLLEHLRVTQQKYSVIWKKTLDNGKVLIRIKKQYNNHFMGEGDMNC